MEGQLQVTDRTMRNATRIFPILAPLVYTIDVFGIVYISVVRSTSCVQNTIGVPLSIPRFCSAGVISTGDVVIGRAFHGEPVVIERKAVGILNRRMGTTFADRQKRFGGAGAVTAW